MKNKSLGQIAFDAFMLKNGSYKEAWQASAKAVEREVKRRMKAIDAFEKKSSKANRVVGAKAPKKIGKKGNK